MRKILRQATLFVCLVALILGYACSGELDLSESKSRADDNSRMIKISVMPFMISAEVNGYEYKKILGKEYTFVKGVVTIQNQGPAQEAFELDALYLSLGPITSEGATVDSIASIFPRMDIKPSQVIRKKVYWAFDGQLPATRLKKAELLYKQKKQ